MTKDTGGQACPTKLYMEQGYPGGYDMGMTLRDWFAGQAFPSIYEYLCKYKMAETDRLDRAAKRSMAAADAMLAAREVCDD